MNDRQSEPPSRRLGRRAAIGAATALLTAVGAAALGHSAEAKPRRKGKRDNSRHTNTSNAVSTGQGGPGGNGGGGGTVVVTCPPVCVGDSDEGQPGT